MVRRQPDSRLVVPFDRCHSPSPARLPSTCTRSRPLRFVTVPLSVALLFGLSVTGAAQESGFGAHITGQAILTDTYVDRIPGGGSLSEARVVQPAIMLEGHGFGDRLRLTLTGDLEGWTLDDGELSPGSWGEGFFDRRHPHTFLHELMLSSSDILRGLDGPLSISLSLGKGFVPFGTDDPMSRPTLRYPMNHHYSQILERAVGIAGISLGPVIFEGSVFNGDEPTTPEDWPYLHRFADSWSLRATIHPLRGIELQGSRAHVHSPEHRPGAGLDVTKWSVSGRWNRSIRGIPAYLLVEWAESSEADRFFVFDSYLAEVQVSPGRHRVYYRLERTKRPEETRTADLFRSIRPHLENSILGVTDWKIQTAGYGFTIGPVFHGLRLEPFGEVSYATVSRFGSGIFHPEFFYGGTTIYSASVGLRLDWGMRGHRMGRYGVAADADRDEMMHHSMQM
ncbi:MAG: hypothetical protein ABI679_15950 [Gemmatimonadota bacterium]